MDKDKQKKSKTLWPFGGTTIKTILAKEKLNEASAKMRSPNLVAKLMGLDGLPPPQPTAKTIEKPFRHVKLDKKTTIEQQYFKDVYEDPEASSHVGNQVCSPQMTAKRISAKLELGYIKERCDEMIRESIAIKTKLERVDSSPDLMLNFLHNDWQDIHFASRCNEITVLKPSYGNRYRSSGKVLKEAVNCRVHVSHQRNENGHIGYSCHCNDNVYRSSRYPLERKDATIISPTEIVVLKPNVAKNCSDKRFLHSADECRKNTESEFYGSEVRSFRHKSREAREIARRITSQMKYGFESGHVNVHHSDHIEYASASSSESETMAVSSRNSFHQSASPKCSHSNMFESVEIREANTRLSQRWKNNRCQDAGMVGKSSILEEMLSVPSCETRAHSKTGYLRCPVGVSDDYEPYGWRDGYLRSTSRSRSLSPSHNQNKKFSDDHEAHADEKPMVHDKHIHRAKFRGVKGTFSHRDISRSKTLQCSKRYHSSQHSGARSPEYDNILPTETYFENKDPAEQESLIPDYYDVTANEASVIDVCMLRDADSSAVDEDSLKSQELATAISPGTVSVHLSPELESCEGSKEFDQHGQISALEVPQTDYLSSGSYCFERVGSQLHELRKQLHLLKLESGTTYDSPTEDVEQRSSSSLCTISESENLESTYLTDLLQHSGFYDPDPCTFITKWYSEDHHRPIDPLLYDHLEKKYSQVPRPERRLFHDRLNEAMFLLSKTMVSWSFGQRGIQTTLTESWFKDQLQKLLDMQEKDASWELEDNHISIDNDLDWLKPASEIDAVCKRVAEVLVDELVLEIVIVCL